MASGERNQKRSLTRGDQTRRLSGIQISASSVPDTKTATNVRNPITAKSRSLRRRKNEITGRAKTRLQTNHLSVSNAGFAGCALKLRSNTVKRIAPATLPPSAAKNKNRRTRRLLIESATHFQSPNTSLSIHPAQSRSPASL